MARRVTLDPRTTAASTVIMFRPGDISPTFHQGHGYEFESAAMPLSEGWEERRNESRTRCGVLLNEMHWVTRMEPPWEQVTLQNFTKRVTYIRFDNASAIGKPCSRCFPPSERGDE